MKNLLTTKTDARVRLNDILVKSHKTTNYGETSLLVFHPKIWDRLSQNIKTETCFDKCNEYIDTWFGRVCKCNICALA